MTLINSLTEKINVVLDKYDRIVSCEVFGDLIIVLCGRFIKYAYIDPDKTIVLEEKLEGLDFKEAKLDFGENVEIYKVVSTCSDSIV